MTVMGYDNANGPWIARYDGSGAFSTSKPYSDWKFYRNDQRLQPCAGSPYVTECSSGQGKINLYVEK